jgi:hypothetical protein
MGIERDSQVGKLVFARRKPFDVLTEGLVSKTSGEDGIRTHGKDLGPYTGLANRRYRPLSHLSRFSTL